MVRTSNVFFLWKVQHGRANSACWLPMASLYLHICQMPTFAPNLSCVSTNLHCTPLHYQVSTVFLAQLFHSIRFLRHVDSATRSTMVLDLSCS